MHGYINDYKLNLNPELNHKTHSKHKNCLAYYLNQNKIG